MRSLQQSELTSTLDRVLFLCYIVKANSIIQKGVIMKPDSMDYAEWVTDQLLYHAVQSIDARLGDGYHVKNPRLVCEMTRLTYEEYLRQEKTE